LQDNNISLILLAAIIVLATNYQGVQHKLDFSVDTLYIVLGVLLAIMFLFDLYTIYSYRKVTRELKSKHLNKL